MTLRGKTTHESEIFLTRKKSLVLSMYKNMNDQRRLYSISQLRDYDPINNTSSNVLIRLANKAGIRIVSGSDDTYNAVMNIVIRTMLKIIDKAMGLMSYDNRQTIKPRDIEYAIRNLGGNTALIPNADTPCANYQRPQALKPTKTGKDRIRKPGTLTNKAIQFYQNQEDCYYIPRTYFESQARVLAAELREDKYFEVKGSTKFSEKAMNLLHGSTESIVVNNLIIAKILMDAKGLQTINGREIEISQLLIRQINTHVL